MDSILRYRMGLSFETIGPVGESEESCLAKFLPASDQIHGKRVILRSQEVSDNTWAAQGPITEVQLLCTLSRRYLRISGWASNPESRPELVHNGFFILFRFVYSRHMVINKTTAFDRSCKQMLGIQCDLPQYSNSVSPYANFENQSSIRVHKKHCLIFSTTQRNKTVRNLIEDNFNTLVSFSSTLSTIHALSFVNITDLTGVYNLQKCFSASRHSIVDFIVLPKDECFYCSEHF